MRNTFITQICFQDVDALVKNFCTPQDAPEKTHKKRIRI